jgi:hypothetical protein
VNDERLQILKMVQDGRLSPEEAANLLDAVEQPIEGDGKTARCVRLLIFEGGKRVVNLTVGLKLAHWLLERPVTEIQGADKAKLLAAINAAKPGRIYEAQEDGKRVELLLEP